MKKLICISLIFYSLLPLQSQNCENPEISVFQWQQANGSLSSYVISCMQKNTTSGFFILLGKIGEDIYTLEGRPVRDDKETFLVHLAISSFSGKRELYPLCEKDMKRGKSLRDQVSQYLKKCQELGLLDPSRLKNCAYETSDAISPNAKKCWLESAHAR